MVGVIVICVLGLVGLVVSVGVDSSSVDRVNRQVVVSEWVFIGGFLVVGCGEISSYGVLGVYKMLV